VITADFTAARREILGGGDDVELALGARGDGCEEGDETNGEKSFQHETP
jgi:hypothetical protein